MKLNVTQRLPQTIFLSWQADPFDEPQDFVSIYESGGKTDSQTNLPWQVGATRFDGLTPNMSYQYRMIGVRDTAGGEIPTALADASATTPISSPAPSPQPPGPHEPPPHPGPPSPQVPGRVTNVVAQAKPFGKIVVSWDPNGHNYSELLVQRLLPNSLEDGGSVVVGNGNQFTDTRSLVPSQTYLFRIEATFDMRTGVYAYSNEVVYPAWFGLKQFLPANFDPSQGIKRLRPNDHPFISVREIMTI